MVNRGCDSYHRISSELLLAVLLWRFSLPGQSLVFSAVHVRARVVGMTSAAEAVDDLI